VRNSLPRLRIDQLMSFNWKFLVPLSIVNVVVTAFLHKVITEIGLAPTGDNVGNFIANIPQTVVLLLGNLLIVGGVLIVLRNMGRQERLTDEAVHTALDERGVSTVHAAGS
jgi:NADH-quinone oxidoreductase subunit H